MAGMGAHLRRNVVAYVALFFSFTGTATALVVTGEIVKDDSLTGADIREATLGEVPRAAEAGVAGDADTLDGKHAADLPQVLARGAGRLVGPSEESVVGPIVVPRGARISVTATLVVSGDDPGTIDCGIVDQGGGGVAALDIVRVESETPARVGLSGAHSSALGTISLDCRSDRFRFVHGELAVVFQGG